MREAINTAYGLVFLIAALWLVWFMVVPLMGALFH